MKYFSEQYKPISFFHTDLISDNIKIIDDEVVTLLRELTFMMSDGEARELVDEFLILHPELLKYKEVEFYYNCC